MKKALKALAVGIALVLAIPNASYAADSAAPVVTNFDQSAQTVDLSKGIRTVTISGNVTDESGVDWISFQCDNPQDNYKRAFSISIMFTAIYPKGSISLTMGSFGAITYPRGSISGDKKAFSFSATAGLPLSTPAANCSWMLGSVDVLGNRGSRVALGGSVENIDDQGATWKAPAAAAPTSTPSPTPTPTPTPSANAEATWKVSGTQLIFNVTNAANKMLRVDSPFGSEKSYISNDDFSFSVKAYASSEYRILIDGVQIAIAHTSSTDGVKAVTGKPVFTANWLGQNLTLSGKNIPSGSLVSFRLGSKIQDFVVEDTSFTKSFENSMFDKIQVLWEGKSALLQQVNAKFLNCSKLNATFLGGVTKSTAALNKGGKTKLTPTLAAKIYAANKSLDRDKDGIACEK